MIPSSDEMSPGMYTLGVDRLAFLFFFRLLSGDHDGLALVDIGHDAMNSIDGDEDKTVVVFSVVSCMLGFSTSTPHVSCDGERIATVDDDGDSLGFLLNAVGCCGF